ncbi:hypothetical protein MABM_25920 [Mycobacteroides abscessus]|uniref:hypothetical protein n=1 Tax=Mycobacteroides abscessus TaxID=36809 RepID=UPI0003A21FB4|nr:hypothetical protein [Mycobacteroides abscessus]BBZ82676.1 hypothetical protein MABM_25920 [Mycobacteroides abscessus]
MSGIDDLLTYEIVEATHPWSFSVQDIVRKRAAGRISDDEALRLMIVAYGGAVMDFEERINKLEGKPHSLGQTS